MAVNIKITKWFDITPHWRLAKLLISIISFNPDKKLMGLG